MPAKSTSLRRSKKDFPLTARGDGRWQKKVRGKVHYFRGSREEALNEWLRVKDDLLAGHDPREKTSAVTVKTLLNKFLTVKQDAVESGELTQRSWNDYKKICDEIKAAFGLTRTIESLSSDDFATLRKQLSKGRSLTTLRNLITRAKVVFKFADDHDLIDGRVRGLAAFKKPSKSDLRKEKERNGGEKLFTRAEICEMREAAAPQIKAMILLGLNCGLGNTDCAGLEASHIDGEWLDYPRPKTGIKRRAKLWPETLEAIDQAGGLPFLTKYGHRWVDGETSDNALSKTFRKLLDDCGIARKGIGFYALRHVYRTVADETKDQPAIDLTMGHARDDMASVYRERISDDRLTAISNYVRSWLFTVDVV